MPLPVLLQITNAFSFTALSHQSRTMLKYLWGFQASRNTAKFHCHCWHLMFNREKDELKIYFYNLQIFYNPYQFFFTW